MGKALHSIAAVVLILCAMPPKAGADSAPALARAQQDEERLSFQTSGPWSPRVDLNADVALVYGIGRNLPQRMADWQKHGYRIHSMTGVAWGSYQDYVYGQWNGKKHEDEEQTRADGTPRAHGRDVYYMSPGEDYGKYLCEGVKRALDAGAIAVCLEEPEFWVETGWEENFKRQWKAYYHEDWQPPDSSAEAQYRASKLKYFLYRRALSDVFEFVHQYAKDHGKKIPCYVATHSLINYAHWRIVSPESSLLQVGCDGYIAQVWTGTSRTPNVYEGVQRERTFDTAFLEYGVMQNLVRASGRRIWYLNDPVEDNANHNWADYRSNWESTLTASLLQPEVWRYEIMPWPQRIFMGRYRSATQPSRREPIPKEYETELQAVISAMGDMKQPDQETRWEACGTRGVGVLVSDTLMFQRAGPHPSDAHMGNFYGLALPLLKRGIPIEPVQIENAANAGFLDRYRLLLLTYEGQKPPTSKFHEALATWVKQGGALVVVDDDKDPFNQVREWWNAAPMTFKTPRQHLFAELGLASDKAGLSRVGKGTLLYLPLSPATLSYRKDGSSQVVTAVKEAAGTAGIEWKESSALVLRRGPYIIAAGLEEPAMTAKPLTLHGKFIPLFDPQLPVVTDFEVTAGKRAVLVDLGNMRGGHEGIVAAACRIRDENNSSRALKFKADGIEGSNAVVCIALSTRPRQVQLAGKPTPVDYTGGILRLHFINSATAIDVVIER